MRLIKLNFSNDVGVSNYLLGTSMGPDIWQGAPVTLQEVQIMTLTIFDPRSGKRVTISLPNEPSGRTQNIHCRF